jgi:hypothetical protein
MPQRKFTTFCRHFWRATFAGVRSGVFGYGPYIVAAALGYLGVIVAPVPAWTSPIINACLAMLCVFAINCVFIAPYRALRMLWPFSIKVAGGHLKTSYPPGPFEPQKAALLVRNRAYLQRSDCVLHIMGVDNASDDIQFPRFITNFSIEPKVTKQLVFAKWTSRKAPCENDRSIFLSGPAGGLGGNIAMLPVGSHNISLRIGIPDGVDIYVRCRVWIERDSLKAAKL